MQSNKHEIKPSNLLEKNKALLIEWTIKKNPIQVFEFLYTHDVYIKIVPPDSKPDGYHRLPTFYLFIFW